MDILILSLIPGLLVAFIMSGLVDELYIKQYLYTIQYDTFIESRKLIGAQVGHEVFRQIENSYYEKDDGFYTVDRNIHQLSKRQRRKIMLLIFILCYISFNCGAIFWHNWS